MVSAPTLRPAEPEDAALLYDWVNRPDSLAAKLQTTEPVRRDVHQKWFDARLDSEACRLFLILLNGERVGQVRLEDRGDGYEVDIYIVPAARGAGIASAAIAQARDALWKTRPDAILVAKVKAENTASQALFNGLGFTVIDRNKGFLTFRLEGSAKTGPTGTVPTS